LLVLARFLNGRLFPPFGIKGLWFYAALAFLVLGELVIEPFFTTPKEAIANGVALLIGAASASLSGAEVSSTTLRVGRAFLFGYALLVIAVSIWAIVFNGKPSFLGRTAKNASAMTGRLGTARWVFSGLLFAVGYAAFAQQGAQLALLYLTWFAIAVLHPVEWLVTWLRRSQPREGATGVVVDVEDPRVVIARLASGSRYRLGARALVGDPPIQGTVVDVTTVLSQPRVRISLDEPAIVRSDGPVRITTESTSVIGHVSPGTSLDELVVDTAVSVGESGLREGRLLSASIGGTLALFQVTRASVISRSDAGVIRDLVHISARKLGSWNEDQTGFEPVAWIPDPGAPVAVLDIQRVEFEASRIGHVPGTRYGISIDLHRAVSHNTAILGILGVGKTHLAWELTKRILVAGIKVVVLDITGRYAAHFVEVFSPDTEDAIARRIENAIQSEYVNRDVQDDEAGNIVRFREVMLETLTEFFEGDARLLILNPNRFRVSRMDGRPFNGRANSMADLTMVEVTRLVAETILRIAQEMDAEERGAPGTPANGDPPVEQARVCLVLEEGHSLVPEWNSVANETERLAVNGSARAILQGRKYGFGCLLITQRTANVTKSILNQCNTVFALRNYDATGMGFLENYVGPTHARLIASLEDREAVVFGRASSCTAPIMLRLNDAEEFRRGYWNEHVQDVPVSVPPEDAPAPGAGPPMDAPEIDHP
jgi:hypothetical protein